MEKKNHRNERKKRGQVTRCLGAESSKRWDHNSSWECIPCVIVGCQYPQTHPHPPSPRVFVRVTRIANRLIPSNVKVRQNVSRFSSKHEFFSWKLHILPKLRTCLSCTSKVWAWHCYEISQAADNATGMSMEIRVRVLVAITFVQWGACLAALEWGERVAFQKW